MGASARPGDMAFSRQRMIYTCYDMVRDCRADRSEGWFYFVSQYVPVVRKLIGHYFPERVGDGSLVQGVVTAMRQPESSLFQSLEPAPERWFVAELRQRVLAVVEEAPGAASRIEIGIEIDLETLGMALEPLTVVEKQATWLETMQYTPAETGILLRMDPRTVEKIRGKAAELIRGKMDAWRRSLLSDTGRQLGRAAAAARTAECLPVKTFLDVLEGRATWHFRDATERHLTGCWHCIDHFCRMAEVVEITRRLAPLPEAEAEPFRRALGLGAPPKPVWKRWFGGA